MSFPDVSSPPKSSLICCLLNASYQKSTGWTDHVGCVMFSKAFSSETTPVVRAPSNDTSGRSRARRKEYVEELESRLRNSDKVGKEASAELQTAAKRVLDENRKLRWLLHMRGVTEPEIAAVLGKSTDKPFDEISSAPALNMMLERRSSSDALPPTSSPSPQLRATSVPRNLHSAAPGTVQATHTTALISRRSHSPSSITSSMGTSPSIPYCTPPYTVPITSQVPKIKSEDFSCDYPHETYTVPWTYSNNYGYTSGVAEYQGTQCASAATILDTMRSDGGTRPAVEIVCPAPIRDYYSAIDFDLQQHSYSGTGI